jgi:hypothetical protein
MPRRAAFRPRFTCTLCRQQLPELLANAVVGKDDDFARLDPNHVDFGKQPFQRFGFSTLRLAERLPLLAKATGRL